MRARVERPLGFWLCFPLSVGSLREHLLGLCIEHRRPRAPTQEPVQGTDPRNGHLFCRYPLGCHRRSLRFVVHYRVAHRGYFVLGGCTLLAGTFFLFSRGSTGRSGPTTPAESGGPQPVNSSEDHNFGVPSAGFSQTTSLGSSSKLELNRRVTRVKGVTRLDDANPKNARGVEPKCSGLSLHERTGSVKNSAVSAAAGVTPLGLGGKCLPPT